MTDHAASIENLARRAAVDLVQVRMDPRFGAVVSTPLLYPSGAHVSVSIRDGGRGSFIITDMGLGAEEVYPLVSPRVYSRAAQRAAETYGVRFDGSLIFAADVPADVLKGGITIVANASRDAVQSASVRLHARESRRAHG